MRKIFSVVSLAAVGGLLFASVAFAANPPATTDYTGFQKAGQRLDNIAKGSGLEEDLQVSIGTVIKGALSLVGVIFLALTVYAGILWMTASGNETQIEKAQGILKAAIIGLVITMSAYAITAFVTGRLV